LIFRVRRPEDLWKGTETVLPEIRLDASI